MPVSPTVLLTKHQTQFGPVLPLDLNANTVCRLDFSAHNALLASENLENTGQFAAFVNKLLQQQQATVGIGGYLENRIIYRRSKLFAGDLANRSIHLGVDIWVEAGTPVLAPLAGVVHSFKDNVFFGDYGPTIILEHTIKNFKFFTLYGHLGRQSLRNLHPGDVFTIGQELGTIGTFPENGDWPPHLHFQVISHMLGLQGDFPGVCSLADLNKFAQLCPDPNLILQCRHLTAF
ncbi:peptidoglycan DD-metalloendopeptidase family protein [Adhaeribacter pallidiroseus]|uniref:M23ase beta-sheet core domain-containing protein n=1 Tax=Adhaeribacter pallidiroseus TaxID=2072847 RepID=A0A369QH02_9BACT|nr:peptidoglycan DD-metalloendopeptidase family protein [Adhaeribacter pallidiroseus]RDC63560.1 hypothetical protein AHMF7616_02165 [Adhaeribacter pallidiroseus]